MASKRLKELMAKQKRVQKTARLGSGARFEALEESIATRGGIRNPAAVAASIGRKKYGSKRFAQLATKGRKG